MIIRAINHVASTLTYATASHHTPNISTEEDHLNDVNNLSLTEKDDTITTTEPDPSYITPATHILQEPKQHNRITTIRLMRSAATHAYPMQNLIKLHIDGGANHSITNDPDLLINYKNIKTYHMSSVGGENDIACTGMGFLPWRSTEGETILIKCYYSKNAPETIISPSDIVMNHISIYHAWTQHADLTTDRGYITFLNKNNDRTTTFPLINKNGLWYYINDDPSDYTSAMSITSQPTIRKLKSTSMYDLMHARLGHPGTRVMTTIHKHAEGVQKFNIPPLYRCATCTLVNATKRAVSQDEVHHIHNDLKHRDTLHMEPLGNNENNTPTDMGPIESDLPGQRFHMDMGFVRGTKFSHRDNDGNLVTSINGYNSYLLIIDRCT